MVKRTPHGESRHEGGERPTAEAARDKAAAREIYRDVDSGFYIFVGPQGRTHVFTSEGEHHTSFRTALANRRRRLGEGRWERISHDELPDKVK